MSGSRRKTAYALLAALTAALIAALAVLPALLCGCSVAATQTSPPAHFRDKEFDFDHEPQAIVRHPLSVITKLAEVKNCVILYPYVLDSGMGTLNLSVFTAFEEFRSSCGVQGGKIEYSLEFNRYGLLSLLMTCLSEDGKPLFYETANFNTDTGLRVSLTECFGAGADPGERLNELVAAYAEANDMTYISSGPNVTDSTQFLFTFGGLTLVFREYELFTPDAGTTRIKVRCAEVQDLLAADGLLNRLK